MFQFLIVITSYRYVMDVFTQLEAFKKSTGNAQEDDFPKFPDTCLLSRIFQSPDTKKMGRFLVLDEATW